MVRADYTTEQRNYKTAPGVSSDWSKPKYFRVQFSRGGAPCGIKVWYGQPLDPVTNELLDRSLRWHVEFLGKLFDEPERFLIHFQPDGSPVIKGDEIPESEYLYLTQLHHYAINHDETMPEADPHKAVNLRKMAPILPPK